MYLIAFGYYQAVHCCLKFRIKLRIVGHEFTQPNCSLNEYFKKTYFRFFFNTTEYTMDSLPIPVVNELTNLAQAIMPSIKTSLVNLKDELQRSSLTLDDGFKQYFLKFINDQ